MSSFVTSQHKISKIKRMKTLTKKQKEANGENFSRIVDDAAILLQRKADYVMNIKQVADYLGISMDAVRKRCQRGQLPFHRSASRLYFSRMEIDDTILDRELLTSLHNDYFTLPYLTSYQLAHGRNQRQIRVPYFRPSES